MVVGDGQEEVGDVTVGGGDGAHDDDGEACA